MSPRALGRYALETMAERDRRVRRERFLAAVVAHGWWICTHVIAFAMGAFVMGWMR